MILLILISGSIYLLKSHINSVTHSRHSDMGTNFIINENTRFLYNKRHQKLYADFIFGKDCRYVAVLYIGYGIHPYLADRLKSYYIQAGYSVVSICANGFSVSGGNKKVDDFILSEELSDWIYAIKSTFGNNTKILLHGFSYTALSVLNCSDSCFAVFSDNIHLFPIYNYKEVRNKFLKYIYKKKSRSTLAGINTPVFLSSEKNLSKETYKLYELSNSKKTIYIYENFDCNEYIKKTDNFIRHLTPPEE